MKKIRITWRKSGINRLGRHRRTIKALGLKRLNHSVEHDATPQILGMIYTVRYLLEIQELS
jgi:large subunit ribosomal protein L30